MHTYFTYIGYNYNLKAQQYTDKQDTNMEDKTSRLHTMPCLGGLPSWMLLCSSIVVRSPDHLGSQFTRYWTPSVLMLFFKQNTGGILSYQHPHRLLNTLNMATENSTYQHSSALSRSQLTVYWLHLRLALYLSCSVSLCAGKALFLCLVQCQAICYHLACLVYWLFLSAFVFWLCLCFLLGPLQYVIDTLVPNNCNFIKIRSWFKLIHPAV